MQRLLAMLMIALATLLWQPMPASAQAAWLQAQTASFNVLYTPGSEVAADFYIQHAEALYDEQRALFGHDLALPLTLRLYPDLELYYLANPTAPRVGGIVAHADFRRNEVVIIVSETRDQDELSRLNNVRHELAHVFAADLSGDRLNVGFQEGVAQLAEARGREYLTKINALQTAYQADQLLPWSALDDRAVVYGDPRISYPQTMTIAIFLVERASFATLREFLTNSARSSGYRSALERTYNLDADALEREWRAWLPGFLAGGYTTNLAATGDLVQAERLLGAGRYNEAQDILDRVRPQLTTDAATRGRFDELHARALQGKRADFIARTARESLLTFRYADAAGYAGEAGRAYTAIGNTEQAAVANTLGELAARGQRAQQDLTRAAELAPNWIQTPAARALADTAAANALALGDETLASQALTLRAGLDQRQLLAGGSVLLFGFLLTLLGAAHAIFNRPQEAW